MEGLNFYNDLPIILETERANGNQDATYEKLINPIITNNENQSIKTRLATKDIHLNDVILEFISE